MLFAIKYLGQAIMLLGGGGFGHPIFRGLTFDRECIAISQKDVSKHGPSLFVLTSDSNPHLIGGFELPENYLGIISEICVVAYDDGFFYQSLGKDVTQLRDFHRYKPGLIPFPKSQNR